MTFTGSPKPNLLGRAPLAKAAAGAALMHADRPQVPLLLRGKKKKKRGGVQHSDLQLGPWSARAAVFSIDFNWVVGFQLLSGADL